MKLKKLFTSLAIAAASVCLAAVMSVSASADYPSSTGQVDNSGNNQDSGQGQSQQSNNQPGTPSYSGGGSGGAVIHFFYLPDSGAKGKMPDVTVSNETYYTLPECTFTPPAGMGFAGWVTFDYISQPKDKYSVGKDSHYYLQAIFSKDAERNKIEYINVTFDNGLTGDKHQSYTQRIKNQSYNKKNSDYSYEQIKLPEPKFKAVEGYEFYCWKNGYQPGDYIYYSKGTEKVTIKATMKTVAVKTDLSTCTITVKQGKLSNSSNDIKEDVDLWMNYVYRGTEIIPIYEVKDKKGNILKEGIDFKAVYSNNKKVGYGKIELTGINGNTGTKTEKFEILDMPFYALYDGYNKLNKTTGSPYHDSLYKKFGYKTEIRFTDHTDTAVNAYLYTGKNITPDISLVFCTPEKEYVLPKSYFTVEYEESKRIGLGSHYVCISTYYKTTNVKVGLYFNIEPPQQKVTSAKIVKDNSKYDGQLLVYFTKLSKELNRIEIQVSYDQNFASNQTNKYTVKGADVSAKYIKLSDVWKNLRKYIRIRYAVEKNGITYYGEWSKTFTVL